MKKLPLIILCALLAASCHKDLRQKAAEEAREYTERYCPTPTQNHVRTDSATFDKQTDTYIYYTTLTQPVDNEAFVQAHKEEISQSLRQSIRESIGLRKYKEAGFTFRYVCRSEQQPGLVLLDVSITPADYR